MYKPNHEPEINHQHFTWNSNQSDAAKAAEVAVTVAMGDGIGPEITRAC